MESRNTPVLFLIFNRPDLTTKVFERIRAFQPKKLFIAADGPRKNRAGEEKLCIATRAETASVDWDCEVQRLYRENNLGCKLAVSSAISWFFQHVENGIILEDDCLPDLSFFHYCSKLLRLYRLEPKVAIISGFNFRTNQPKAAQASYYFSKYPQIWGWATWRTTWEDYDVEMNGWNGIRDSLSGISNPRMRRHFAKKFDSVKTGGNDTWDYQLIHQCLTAFKLAIIPSQNLVQNIGFDERATHTVHYSSEGIPPPSGKISFPLVHPYNVVPNENEDRWTETHFYRVPPNRWISLIWSARKRLRELRNSLRVSGQLNKK